MIANPWDATLLRFTSSFVQHPQNYFNSLSSSIVFDLAVLTSSSHNSPSLLYIQRYLDLSTWRVGS
jgi:hypothetical protein